MICFNLVVDRITLLFPLTTFQSFQSLSPPAHAETEAGGCTVERAQGDRGVVSEGGGGGDQSLPVQQVPAISLLSLLLLIILAGGLDHRVVCETQILIKRN